MKMLLVVALTLAGAQTFAQQPPAPADVQHALNRAAFGPRPGEVERVRAIGLRACIDQQLRPERVDDAALGARLERLPDGPRRAEPAMAAAADPRMERRMAARQDLEHLTEERLLRAIYSERQLEEVLVDFWFNHF